MDLTLPEELRGALETSIAPSKQTAHQWVLLRTSGDEAVQSHEPEIKQTAGRSPEVPRTFTGAKRMGGVKKKHRTTFGHWLISIDKIVTCMTRH